MKGSAHHCDNPCTLSSDDHVHASVTLPLVKIITEPLASAYELVGELMLLLRPDLASSSVL